MNADDVPIFLISVDGVHCRCYEPWHPLHSKNPEYYSHKFHQAGLTYELGIAVYESKLVWINGPFPAGQNDITVYRKALKAKIPDGKKVIGDRGYRGEKATIRLPNSHNTKKVRQFMGRARARHESFNSRIKNFAVLSERFRHGEEKHKWCFEAVCVIVQYQMDNGSPLFDV